MAQLPVSSTDRRKGTDRANSVALGENDPLGRVGTHRPTIEVSPLVRDDETGRFQAVYYRLPGGESPAPAGNANWRLWGLVG